MLGKILLLSAFALLAPGIHAAELRDSQTLFNLNMGDLKAEISRIFGVVETPEEFLLLGRYIFERRLQEP